MTKTVKKMQNQNFLRCQSVYEDRNARRNHACTNLVGQLWYIDIYIVLSNRNKLKLLHQHFEYSLIIKSHLRFFSFKLLCTSRLIRSSLQFPDYFLFIYLFFLFWALINDNKFGSQSNILVKNQQQLVRVGFESLSQPD